MSREGLEVNVVEVDLFWILSHTQIDVLIEVYGIFNAENIDENLSCRQF